MQKGLLHANHLACVKGCCEFRRLKGSKRTFSQINIKSESREYWIVIDRKLSPFVAFLCFDHLWRE
jgi:hypothetical protein